MSLVNWLKPGLRASQTRSTTSLSSCRRRSGSKWVNWEKSSLTIIRLRISCLTSQNFRGRVGSLGLLMRGSLAFRKGLEHAQTDLLTFFRVKLGGEDILAPDGRGERSRIISLGGRGS